MDNEVIIEEVSPSSFDLFNARLQSSILTATKNSSVLPDDVAFHKSLDSSFARKLDSVATRTLSLANRLLALSALSDANNRSQPAAELGHDDVLDRFFGVVVDPLDHLFEKTDTCLDELLGRRKPPAIGVNVDKQKYVPSGSLDPRLKHASTLRKPQLLFKTKINNGITEWFPNLPYKYNAQVALGHVFHDSNRSLTANHQLLKHPYHYEITHISYPSFIFEPPPPITPKPFSSTPFTWVTTPDDLQAMLLKLRLANEIAIDLEHHDYRSYAGFTCLMQISTREEDWIVDTLVLREELQVLNDVFTNPNIVKVLHGADSDIIWLQQDFSLYIVNMFDTYHASRVLEFPRHGLAHLLEMYCDFTPDKRYQLADWRIRPLPQEMLDYARSDTHSLLFIYDNLRHALLDRAQSRPQSPTNQTASPYQPQSHRLIREVLARSEEVCLRIYDIEKYDFENGTGNSGWSTLAEKWNKIGLTPGGTDAVSITIHREVYRNLHHWRDHVARDEDESVRYVLSNQHLFQLVEKQPEDMAALLSVFSSVPPIVRKRASELLNVIQQVLSQRPASKPVTPVQTPVREASPIVDSLQHAETVIRTIWSHEEPLPHRSSLFGSSLESRVPLKLILSRPTSLLFGKTLQSNTIKERNVERFQTLLTQINSSLSIIPTVSVAGSQSSVVERDVVMISSEPANGTEVELAFVPTSRRKPMEVVDDSIVVVGQTKSKKRKRGKKTESQELSIPEDGSVPKKLKGEDDADQSTPTETAFDFSAVPNILDDNPSVDDGKKKPRTKKKAKAEAFYGDFPAPPKAHSELKKGNQSHTFK